MDVSSAPFADPPVPTMEQASDAVDVININSSVDFKLEWMYHYLTSTVYQV